MNKLDLSEYCSILIYGRPGSGKTQFIRFFLNLIPYKHLFVITSSPEQFEDYNSRLATIEFDYNIEQVDSFLNKKGVKVVVLDDFLHLNFNGNTGKALRRLLSTCRHTQTYVLIGTQLLNTIGKAFRNCSKIFLTAQIDYDSVELLRILTGKSKSEIMEIKLNRYEFLLADIRGNSKKIKLRLDHTKDA